MPFKQGTYAELIAMDDEFRKLESTNPGIFFLLQGKIKDFRKANAERLKSIYEQMNLLMQEHVMKDEQGKFRTTEKGNEWLFFTEADRDTYTAERKSLYERPCNIVC